MSKIEPLVGERQPGETRQAVLACNDYLRMGAGRSLSALHAQYCTDLHRSAPPAKGLRTLKEWSSVFGWQARAEDYDTAIEEEKNRIAVAERKAIMEHGIALEHERVKRLAVVEQLLYSQITATEPRKKKIQDVIAELSAKHEAEEAKRKEAEKRRDVEDSVAQAEIRDGARPLWLVGDETDTILDEDKNEDEAPENVGSAEASDVRYPYLWLQDYKGVAGVPYEIERYNAALVAQWRGILDDAAKETGGRKLRGGDSSVVVNLTAEDLSRAQLDVQQFIQDRFGDLPNVQAGSPERPPQPEPPAKEDNARNH